MKKDKPLICIECGKNFLGWKKTQKCCSFSCRGKYNAKLPTSTCFKKGIKVWNKNLKGIHLSPKSEFKKGNKPHNMCRIGKIVKRKECKTRSVKYIKIANPRKWTSYARYIYQKNYGEIPKGFVVIHKDFDLENHKPNNLKAVSRAKSMLYYKELREAFNPRFNAKYRRNIAT